jgi:hypothetical protein
LFAEDRMITGKLIYVDGSIYNGEVSADARRHGKGVYSY